MMKFIKLLLFTVMAAASLTSCLKTPESPYVAFPSSAYSFSESDGTVSVPVRIYNTPYFYPVKVTVVITSSEGLITVENTELTVDITNDNDTKIYFDVIDDFELNSSAKSFEISILSVDGADIGSTSSTTVTIVDDEYAPRLTTGDYTVGYHNDFETYRNSDEFTLTLRKVGKYTYAAYGWFGLDQPRLEGTFDPETNTITFDGSVHTLDVNDETEAFGTAYWFNNLERTEALVFRGAGADGTGSIVLSTTENIQMNEVGYLTVSMTDCRYDIYDCTVEESIVTLGDYKGVYDIMPVGATFTYQSDEDDEDATTKSIRFTPTPIGRPVKLR